MLVPVFLFAQSMGSTADGPVCPTESKMLNSREGLQTGIRTVFAEKDSRGSWFLLSYVNLRHL